MKLTQTILEFFMSNGATSLVVSALITFIYVVYRISRLNSVAEFRAGRYAVLWIIIALPQILAIFIAEEYKHYLSTHSLKLTAESCKAYRNKDFFKDQKCELNGRVLDDQNNRYLFQLNEQKLQVKKCDVVNIRIRGFAEYQLEFRNLYQQKSVYDVIFGGS